MKPLITGGAGYIGTNLSAAIPEAEIFDIKNGLDILDKSELVHALDNASVVYHLAALSGKNPCESNPRLAFRTNCRGSFNIFRMAKNRDIPVVFASSIAAVLQPEFYGVTKAIGENLANYYDVVTCRISNVYGGLNYEKKSTVISRFLQENPITIHGDGKQLRDFIHVNDVVQALKRAAELGSGTYNISTGTLHSINDVVEIVQTIRDIEIEFKEKKTVDSPHIEPSSDLIENPIELEEGIQMTWELMK